MSSLVTTVFTGITTFAVTNLDDLMILTLLFSQVNQVLRRRHIVMGQYLGFSALILCSIPGFWGSLVLPQQLIGLLGLVPITMGLSQLLNPVDENPQISLESELTNGTPVLSFLSPQTYGVAAVTIAFFSLVGLAR
ncbi:cadmium resistance transporter [Neosynechococcus sphagnicola]|uniref:cadmium resistance transporter n=1 Tax=Neosynechococcus sphagnicola TaxID=1501145 RepID=UPI00068F9091|nr:cadmium resistance transporter [Neosynechococcus sphagnicola]